MLSSFDFLRDSTDHLFFSSLFFHNFIIDILFLTPQKLWSFVLDDDLDHVFGLGGTAIAAALRDFHDGFYVKLDSSAVQWCEDYTRTMRIITGMGEQPAHKEWLVTCQQNLMARGQAGLPPTTTVDRDIDKCDHHLITHQYQPLSLLSKLHDVTKLHLT